MRLKNSTGGEVQSTPAFVDLFLEAYKRPPKQIVFDLDATDNAHHGHVFCGRHLLAALLRPSNIDASACPYRTEFALAHLRLATWTGPPPARVAGLTLRPALSAKLDTIRHVCSRATKVRVGHAGWPRHWPAAARESPPTSSR